MSVENDHRDIYLSCDAKRCNETTEPYDRDEFNMMIYEAKRAGWKIENRRGQYFHTCPACAEDDGFEAVEL